MAFGEQLSAQEICKLFLSCLQRAPLPRLTLPMPAFTGTMSSMSKLIASIAALHIICLPQLCGVAFGIMKLH
jgi:hypothetical protein